MQLVKLGSFALVAALAVGATGCVVRAHGHARFSGPRVVVPTAAVVVVEEEPPPPRQVYIETRPGFVYIQGRWHRHGNRWEWRDGYYERERSGHLWVDGNWQRRGNGWVYVEGSWRAGGSRPAHHQPDHGHGPTVRDHRRGNEPPPPPPPQGPVIRDHRR